MFFEKSSEHEHHLDYFESEENSFKSLDVKGLFEASKFMKLMGGSHGGENWRVSIFWVWLRVAQSRWLAGWLVAW